MVVNLDYSSSEDSSDEGPYVFHEKRDEGQAGPFSVGKIVATVLVAGYLTAGGYLLSQRVRRRVKKKRAGKAGRQTKQEAAAEERSKRKRTRAR